MKAILAVKEEIIADPANYKYLERGWQPVFKAHSTAKVLIVGQAPSLGAQRSGTVFRDVKGARLATWLGIDRKTLLESKDFAILPMDFYCQGISNDTPARPFIASQYHTKLIECMPNIELTVLVGKEAQRHYLSHRMKRSVTDTVRSFNEYLPDMFPLVNPSPLNNKWIAKYPFYNQEVIPTLRERVKTIIE